VELEALVLRVYILDVRVAAVGLGGVELGLRMCVLAGTGRGERGFVREGRRLTATGASIMMINDADSVSISTSQVLRSPFYLGRTRAQIDTKTTLLQGSRASNILRLPLPPRITPFLSCPIPSYPILILLPKYIPSPARLPVSLGTDKPAQSPRSGQFGTVAPITHMCGWRGCQDWESPVVGLW
jgi:hypothetical protein